MTPTFIFLSLFIAGMSTACSTETNERPPSDAPHDTDTQTELSDGETTEDTEMAGHEAFEQSELLEYRFAVEDDDLLYIEEHGNDEEYVPAILEIFGGDIDEVYSSVGLRHKGSWTLHHCYETGQRSYNDECAKLSYKVKFSEYDEKGRFYGLKRINLHAMSGEGSKLKERLAYETFNRFGVDAPRTAYAKVFLNNDYMGLFLQVEQIDGRFTAFHYPEDGDGNLYKEVWPKEGVSEESYREHLKTNDHPEDNPDVSDMLGFARAVSKSTVKTFNDEMADWVDTESLLRYMAVDRAIHNWDGIVTFYHPYSPHNFFWYHEADQEGLFHLIPWDLDGTFWEFDPFMDPQDWVTADPIPDWNVAPAHCDPRPVWDPDQNTTTTPPGCDKLLSLLAQSGWNRFVALGEALLDGPLDFDVMDEKLTEWTALIEDAVRADPFIDADDWKGRVRDVRSDLRNVIADFKDHLTEGYREEAPIETIPEPDEEALNEPHEEGGLEVSIINNFEFESGEATTLDDWAFSIGADASIHTPMWNTDDPLSGEADLRFEFEFHRTEGAWDEWVNLFIETDEHQEFDLSDYTEISLTMMADHTRNVRVRLNSPVYEDQFGGAWSEFGVDFSVTTEPKIYKMKLANLYYPDWAKDAWNAGDGWSGSDSSARDDVIAAFSGLVFSPSANTDGQGEMYDETDPGFLQIDNIYFR